MKNIKEDYEAAIKYKEELAYYLKKNGVEQKPEKVMNEIIKYQEYYYSLHLLEATGVQQQIGRNMI